MTTPRVWHSVLITGRSQGTRDDMCGWRWGSLLKCRDCCGGSTVVSSVCSAAQDDAYSSTRHNRERGRERKREREYGRIRHPMRMYTIGTSSTTHGHTTPHAYVYHWYFKYNTCMYTIGTSSTIPLVLQVLYHWYFKYNTWARRCVFGFPLSPLLSSPPLSFVMSCIAV